MKEKGLQNTRHLVLPQNKVTLSGATKDAKTWIDMEIHLFVVAGEEEEFFLR